MINIEFITPTDQQTGSSVISVNEKTGKVVLNAADVGAATTEYVDNAIALLEIPDTKDFATKAYVEAAVSQIDPEVDLSNYATKTYVETAIDAIPEVDLSGYATQAYVDFSLETFEPNIDTSLYATKQYARDVANEAMNNHHHNEYPTKIWVQSQIANIEAPDLSNYATKLFVENSINAIPETDLSNYYTKAQTTEKIDALDAEYNELLLKYYATYNYVQQHVQQKIAEAQLSADGEVDLSPYATKMEVSEEISQSLSSYYTKGEVDKKIANLDIPEAEVDLSNYYTKSQVDAKIDAIEIPEGGTSADLTNYYTKTEIDKKGYQTEIDVQDAIYKAAIAGVEVKEVYVGEEAPADNNAMIWINPNGSTTGGTGGSADMSDYYTKTQIDTAFATKAYVEELIGGIENGSY